MLVYKSLSFWLTVTNNMPFWKLILFELHLYHIPVCHLYRLDITLFDPQLSHIRHDVLRCIGYHWQPRAYLAHVIKYAHDARVNAIIDANVQHLLPLKMKYVCKGDDIRRNIVFVEVKIIQEVHVLCVFLNKDSCYLVWCGYVMEL